MTTTRTNYEERNDVRATSQVLQNFDLSFDLLLFHWLEDLYDAFVVVSNVDGFEYFRIFSSTELSHKLEEIFFKTRKTNTCLPDSRPDYPTQQRGFRSPSTRAGGGCSLPRNF